MQSNEQRFDPSSFRKVLSHYPTGVCVVTATDPDGSHLGFVVGTFNSVSLDPPLIGFYPDKRSSSWARISKVGKFCVNVLASGQQDLCSRFSSRLPDKFASVSHRVSENGSPILDAVVAWLDCSLEAEHAGGRPLHRAGPGHQHGRRTHDESVGVPEGPVGDGDRRRI